jgi:acyl-coenzyme A synthetase/AMP-(fatty) acid ligase
LKYKVRKNKPKETDIDLSFLQQEINTDLLEQLYDIVATHPDHIAIRWHEEQLTYGVLIQRVEHTARKLREQGVNEQSRLLLFHPNSIDYVILLLAGLTTGAVLIPVDYKLAPDLLQTVIHEAAPNFASYPAHLADRIRREEHMFARDVRFLIFNAGGDPGQQEANIDTELVEQAPQRAHQHTQTRVVYFYRNQRGKMIGAEFRVNKLVSQAHKVRRRFSIFKSDHLLCQMSLAHFVILSNMLFPSLLSSATLLLLDRDENDERVDEIIERYSPHLTVNTRKYYYIMLKHMRESGRKHKIVNCVMIYDGTRLDWMEEFEEQFRSHLLPGLASPLIAGFVTLTLPFLCRVEGSVGTPMIGVEYHIINREGEVLPAGEWGELVIDSPYGLDNFYNNTDLQFEKAVEDYYRTHQMARQDAGGYLYLADEVQDVIRLRGFKISPLEIEEELMKLPGVDDAVATNGFTRRNETILAFVKLEEGSQLTSDEVFQEACQAMPGYLHPEKVLLVDEIPYSNEDRKMRVELRERMENQITGGSSESV